MGIISKKTAVLILIVNLTTQSYAQGFSFQTVMDDLKQLQTQMVPDKRVAVLEVEIVDTLSSRVVVKGETDLPDAKRQIIDLLTNKHIPFIDSIRVLPDERVGTKTWALASLSVSNLRFGPDHSSELVSQALMGTPMKILDVKGIWLRVQTPDEYIGWMDAGGLFPLTLQELENWKKSDRYLFNQMNGFVYEAPHRKGDVLSDLVLGDIFEAHGHSRRFVRVKLPDGRTGFVYRKQCMSFDTWCQVLPNEKSVIAVARQMMGFPYLWGGTSCKALDCSGFVKLVFYSQGILLARDASQQGLYGKCINVVDIQNLTSGDLLFFGRSPQRITHVGIYMGKGEFIHSSGRVHVSSLLPEDPRHVPSRKVVAARRVLGSIGERGIVRVKDHPWFATHP